MQKYIAHEKKKNKQAFVRKSTSFSHRKSVGKTRALSVQVDRERSLVPQPVPAGGPSLFQGVQGTEPVVRPRGGEGRERHRPGMPDQQMLGQGDTGIPRHGTDLFFFSAASNLGQSRATKGRNHGNRCQAPCACRTAAVYPFQGRKNGHGGQILLGGTLCVQEQKILRHRAAERFGRLGTAQQILQELQLAEGRYPYQERKFKTRYYRGHVRPSIDYRKS